MKIILWLLGLVVTLVIGLYVIVFTPIGNAVLSPMLETKIQEQTKLDSKLRTFDHTLMTYKLTIMKTYQV